MKLATLFTDHAVFQRGLPIKIFGEGKGRIKVEFLSSVREESINDNGWCITLPSVDSYGGPYEMKIDLDGEEIILRDLYVGEVWLAGGQSNMEMPLFRTHYGIDEGRVCENEMIRFFTVPRRVKRDTPERGWNFEPTDGMDTPWQLCCEESALHFTAIGYYVAKELCRELNCAVGVISCNWGGKPIEVFIGKKWIKKAECMRSYCEAQMRLYTDYTEEKFRECYLLTHKALDDRFYNANVDVVDRARRLGLSPTTSYPAGVMPVIPDGPYNPNTNMGILYDSMYSRIIPYGIKGILWYQGESNAADGYADKYGVYMECMKESFENPELDFYAIELASFALDQNVCGTIVHDRYVTGGGNWAYKREEQELAARKYKNSYLVTSMELGDAFDIHPKEKRILSHRMALKALKHSYGFDIYADQPTFKKATFSGNTVTVELDNSEGLYSVSPTNVFIYLCDESHVMKKADYFIKDGMLILSSPEVEKPTEVRYAFDNYYGGAHIYNCAGLPLAPFRAVAEAE